VLALAGACSKPDAGALARKPPPPAVKVALTTATVAPTPDVLVLTGLIAADQRSDVTADTQGKVLVVLVERGQRVKMGDPLVRLDVRNAALGAREAQANLAAARAQRQLAEDECKRSKTLLERGAITQSEFDRQNTSCTAALQQVSAAEARADMISKSVNDGVVRAPFEGVIADKMVSAGEWVMPGKPLFTLVDDDPLKIQLSVPEVAIRAVAKDQRVELFTVSHPGQPFHATVTRLGGEIGRTRSLIIEAQLDKGSGLVPGMFAEAHVVIGQVPRPVLPETAVAKRGQTFHAFVAVKGELEERVVQIGPSPGPGKVAISNGVVAGEQVVTTVTDQITDGLRVE
jgi:membrane fusion protein (multidrug efflux system)